MNQKEEIRYLKKGFSEILTLEKNQDKIINDLVGFLKANYILLYRKPLYCKDCFHCNMDIHYSFTSSYQNAFCKYYRKRINFMNPCSSCEHYISGSFEAEKSIARMRNEINGDWIQKM